MSRFFLISFDSFSTINRLFHRRVLVKFYLHLAVFGRNFLSWNKVNLLVRGPDLYQVWPGFCFYFTVINLSVTRSFKYGDSGPYFHPE
jgi:hypothetical protein